jgi:WD40 repeat protein
VTARWQTPPHPNTGHYIHGNGALRFGPDGRTLFVWGSENVARAFDPDTGEPRYVLSHPLRCHGLRLSPDGRHVATASFDKTARVWDCATGQPLTEPLPHPDWVFDAHFHSDGRHLLTTCRDGTARVWDWEARRVVSPPLAHRDELHPAAFTPDGRWVVTASIDGTARVWDWRGGTPVTPPVALNGKGLSVTVSPDGRRAVIGGFGAALAVIDLGDLSAPDELSADDLCTWAELLSGQRVHEGGGVTNLAGGAWLHRWRGIRPPAPSSSPGQAAVVRSFPAPR